MILGNLDSRSRVLAANLALVRLCSKALIAKLAITPAKVEAGTLLLSATYVTEQDDHLQGIVHLDYPQQN